MANRRILLAVDLQRDFIDGSLAVPGAGAILPEIMRIRKDFDRVYFTLDWHPLNHCSFREQGGPWPVHCVHYSAGASIPEQILEGLDEDRVRFICKGCHPQREEYGAFAHFDPANQDLFSPGDELVIGGIAAEYCVLETLRNLHGLSTRLDFSLKVFLEGTACFERFAPLEDFMSRSGIPAF